MLQNRVLPPLRNKPYGGAWSIHDPVSLDYLKSIAPEKGNRKEFLHDYKDWIGQDKKFIGLKYVLVKESVT